MPLDLQPLNEVAQLQGCGGGGGGAGGGVIGFGGGGGTSAVQQTASVSARLKSLIAPPARHPWCQDGAVPIANTASPLGAHPFK